MKISIIIPTAKNSVATLESLKSCPFKHKVVVSREKGLGFARNWGARQAGDGLLVFMDDDLKLDPEIWSLITATKRGTVKMYDDGTYKRLPYSSRVLAIWSQDFWKVGGFDEDIRYYGEDVDFLIRALDAGLQQETLPTHLVTHIPHKPRSKFNMRVFLGLRCDQAHCLLKHGRKYLWMVHGGFWNYVKKVVRRPRNFFPIFPALLYQILRRIMQ